MQDHDFSQNSFTLWLKPDQKRSHLWATFCPKMDSFFIEISNNLKNKKRITYTVLLLVELLHQQENEKKMVLWFCVVHFCKVLHCQKKWWDNIMALMRWLIRYIWFSLEEREGRDIIRRGWGNLWGFPEFGGPVAPFFDDGFLDHAGIGFAIDTHLLGNLDTIGFGDESTREKIQD